MTPWTRLAAVAASLAVVAAAPPASAFDVSLYASLLDLHTREVPDPAGVRVDYAALAREPAWRVLVDSLDDVSPAMLVSRDQRLAFWINAYNILAIDMIVRHRPVESIRDIGSFFDPVWKKPAGRAGGADRTLHEIEHEILRPMGEPRVHAAIVCASVSCPALRRAPFSPEDLGAQLDEVTAGFLANPEKGLRLDATQRTVYLSAIFKWFDEDFAAGGGVLPFVARFAPQPANAWLRQNANLARVRHLEYDWSLNGLGR